MKSIKLASITTALLLASAAAQANVSISNKPTKNVDCSGSTCTATAKNAVVNVGDLQNMLATGDASVKTGAIAKDIDIDQPLTWATSSRLTLDAQQSVVVTKPMTVTGTGALSIATKDGGKYGEFIFGRKASVQFWDLASSLVIDGNSYTLVGDIKTLAADIASNPSGFYALAKPYDASTDGIYASSPIPTIFEGVYEGLGNTIKNLAIYESARTNVGLFYEVDVLATVENLNLVSASVQAPEPPKRGQGKVVGGLTAVSSGLLRNDTVSGRVEGSKRRIVQEAVGGLAGANYGIIDGCTSRANVAHGSVTGGLVGELINRGQALIVNSHVDGKISGFDNVGGLVGYAGPQTTIASSSARGLVSAITANDGVYAYAGGLVGKNLGTISTSFAVASVLSDGAVGGLLGDNEGAVDNSYSTGPVSSKKRLCNDCGGFIGSISNSLAVVSSYSTGYVSIAAAYSGGFVGQDLSRTLSNDYWNLDTSGIPDLSQGAGQPRNDPGVTGLTDTQLKSRLPDGFNPKIWGSNPDINNGYPYLLANPPPK